MQLQQIRTPTLRPLQYHTRQPKHDYTLRYQPLAPALRLYLSNNLLDDVPGEVFLLQNLDVLSLRSNNLTDVLPPIGKLTKLRELNLGSNQLNWLPWELLQPILSQSLKKFMLYPNPFIRPVPSTWNWNPHGKASIANNCQVASTRIAFLDINGSSHRNSWPPAPSSLPEHWPEPAGDSEFLGPPTEDRASSAPSLLEIALRACYKSPQLSQLPFLLPHDCPAHLTELVKKTFRLKEAGGQTCSVCKREYIVPRTEWVEWWYCESVGSTLSNRDRVLAQNRGPVPFLRRGCSWSCWEEVEIPLIRGWSSAFVPGGRQEPVGVGHTCKHELG